MGWREDGLGEILLAPPLLRGALTFILSCDNHPFRRRGMELERGRSLFLLFFLVQYSCLYTPQDLYTSKTLFQDSRFLPVDVYRRHALHLCNALHHRLRLQ